MLGFFWPRASKGVRIVLFEFRLRCRNLPLVKREVLLRGFTLGFLDLSWLGHWHWRGNRLLLRSGLLEVFLPGLGLAERVDLRFTLLLLKILIAIFLKIRIIIMAASLTIIAVTIAPAASITAITTIPVIAVSTIATIASIATATTVSSTGLTTVAIVLAGLAVLGFPPRASVVVVIIIRFPLILPPIAPLIPLLLMI